MEHDNNTGTMSDLVSYRLQKSQENLNEAKGLSELGLYSGANNRIYYSLFNSMLAIHALDNRHTSSHKRTIGEFNRIYIKSGEFAKEYGKEITKIEVIRHASDYDNFYTPNEEETRANYIFAEKFLAEVKEYCQKRLNGEKEAIEWN